MALAALVLRSITMARSGIWRIMANLAVNEHDFLGCSRGLFSQRLHNDNIVIASMPIVRLENSALKHINHLLKHLVIDGQTP